MYIPLFLAKTRGLGWCELGFRYCFLAIWLQERDVCLDVSGLDIQGSSLVCGRRGGISAALYGR